MARKTMLVMEKDRAGKFFFVGVMLGQKQKTSFRVKCKQWRWESMKADAETVEG